jgi:peptidoglycan/xylan/chitin deacetylase (PgdA/CDA1 family)
MGVGAHTVSHPILAGLCRERARQEIADSAEVLRGITGMPVALFAYPNGKPGVDFDSQSVDVVRQSGFEAAFTTVSGAANRSSDPHQLPRFAPWDRDRLRFGLRMLGNLS